MLSLLVGIVIYAMAHALITFCYRRLSSRRSSSGAKEESAARIVKKDEPPPNKLHVLSLLIAMLALPAVIVHAQTNSLAGSQVNETAGTASRAIPETSTITPPAPLRGPRF